MLKMWRVWICVGLIFFWLAAPFAAYAAGSCGAIVQPHSVTPSSSTVFAVTATNNGSNNLRWFNVIRPSDNFVISAASATGWFARRTTDHVVFDTGSLAPGGSVVLKITATAGVAEVPSANWSVQSSESPSGAGPVSCSGDTSTTIANLPPAPTLSDISVINITTTTATITWNTDQPSNSVARYGATSSYGQNASSAAAVTAHSLALSGLSAGTNYHFQAESTNGTGTSTSGDNIFSTVAAPASKPGPASAATPANVSTPAASRLQIQLNPLSKTIYEEPPVFSGTASDPAGISLVEYSLDNGGNWLAAALSGPAASPSFSFTPANLPDGNYTVLARASNTHSEQKLSDAVNLVIDKLPPAIGGVQTAIGPQFLEAGSTGLLETAAGIDQKISVQAIGGPTSVIIRAYNQANPLDQHSFSLSRIPGTELWSAVTSFSQPGRYHLEATAIDGANRRDDKSLGDIIAAAPIKLTSGNKPAQNVAATLYAWEPSLNNWVVWPAEAYGQTNPQHSATDGQLRFYLPAGRYYLQLNGAYRKTLSDIITLDKASALTGSVILDKSPAINLGPLRLKLPSIWPKRFKLKVNEPQKAVQAATTPSLKDFTLNGPNGRKLTNHDVAGHQTALIYVPTWAPAAAEQLAILSSLDAATKAHVIAFTELEDPAAIQAYKSVSGYSLDIWLDENSQLSKQLGVIHTPTTVLVDKNGVIKTLMSGILPKQAIIELTRSQ